MASHWRMTVDAAKFNKSNVKERSFVLGCDHLVLHSWSIAWPRKTSHTTFAYIARFRTGGSSRRREKTMTTTCSSKPDIPLAISMD
jgi:hypothetical protein